MGGPTIMEVIAHAANMLVFLRIELTKNRVCQKADNPIYLHIRFCRKFALKQKHNWISFVLYVMQNNSDVLRAHRCWYVVPFLNKYYLCLFTVCKTLPFLSIMYNDNSFLLAAMTEKPGSELQK